MLPLLSALAAVLAAIVVAYQYQVIKKMASEIAHLREFRADHWETETRHAKEARHYKSLAESMSTMYSKLFAQRNALEAELDDCRAILSRPMGSFPMGAAVLQHTLGTGFLQEQIRRDTPFEMVFFARGARR